ncbi:MAG: hypothetical protein WEB58_16825 [Planctomycetaceae bacterium]
MPKNRLSRNQKRSAKLAKRAQMSPQADSRAIAGTKFKTDELAPLWLACETAIYQSFVVSEHRLRDNEVYSAIEKVISQIECDVVTPPEDDAIHYVVGEETDLVVQLLQIQLDAYDDDHGPLLKKDIIGILRSILGTIEFKRTHAPQSQAYIRYVVDFLKRKVGIKIRQERAIN